MGVLIDQVVFSLPTGGALELLRAGACRVAATIIPDRGGARGPTTTYEVRAVQDCFAAANEVCDRIGFDVRYRLAQLIAEIAGPRPEPTPSA